MMDLSTDLLIDLQAGTAHTIHHLILDQISEGAMGTWARTARTDRTSTGTTAETEGTNKIPGLIKEIIVFKTGTTTIKTEIGLTTGEDEQIPTSQKPTQNTGNLRVHQPKATGANANSKKFH